jgi:methionyl-tRNA formyltransferase
MRIVFFGSPDFAVATLRALLAANREVVAVVTQPDRPAGRGHGLLPPPVKIVAQAHALPVLQPARVSDPEPVEELRGLQPDVFIVAAYGQILRQRVLDLPTRGALNVHASLLPRHRGASPIAAAILAGDVQTGVTIMEMVRALDAGPMVARVEIPIAPFDTTGTLEPRLAVAGAHLLSETLDGWYEGKKTAVPQDESLVTYAPQLRREDAILDWSRPAEDLWRRVRAFNPWPVAHTTLRGAELRILDAWPLAGDSGAEPGTVLGPEALPSEAGPQHGETFSVQTGSGRLAVRRLQLAGRKPMNGSEFLRGQRNLIGAKLGVSEMKV